MKKLIALLGFGKIDYHILRRLKKSLKWVFKEYKLGIDIITEPIKLTHFEFDKKKNKYNADLIIKKLNSYAERRKYYRILGVLDEEIYSSTRNYIFGSAHNPELEIWENSKVAILSVYRLDEKFYRRSENKPSFELRVYKEAIHELGHTLGLFHCENECVMKISTYVDDIEKKPPKFCEPCSLKLKNFLGLED